MKKGKGMNENEYEIPGLYFKEHYFECPLDHNQLSSKKIIVFAREVVSSSKKEENLPFLLFLQGGPGFPSPRPLFNEGWMKRALKEFRVLYLDQRGTGKSSAITHQSLSLFNSPQEQAEYLKNFRSDSIVNDCEMIRKQLIGDEKWSVLGQSYGGFCITRYLSAAPEGLREVFLTGGLPITEGGADRVYQHTYPRVLIRNKAYYERYPEDVLRIREIAEFLIENDVELPGGGRLTARRFQQYGMGFGFVGGFENLHYMVLEAFVETSKGKELSYSFLRTVENSQSFETNPIFAILHESIYCHQFASNWAAERVHNTLPEFEIKPEEQDFYFVGEMVFSWMFDDYKYLQPLKEAAEILAQYKDWPCLYDFNQLAKNEVPVAAAVYYDDMLVERKFSEETAAKIKGISLWVTNEFDHGGLR
ncbi:MAG: pimeloyl-ACP methyl ester carboxylesterase, partial [Candidatus Azotimanducaceae bacterium]